MTCHALHRFEQPLVVEGEHAPQAAELVGSFPGSVATVPSHH